MRTSDYSEAISKYIVMPHHGNPSGLMFGGILMSWMDMAAAMVAEKHSGMDVATVSVDSISFKSPIKVGDHITVHARLIETGNTSMKIEVTVSSENPKVGSIKKTTNAFFTFVAVDHSLRPCSVPKLHLSSH